MQKGKISLSYLTFLELAAIFKSPPKITSFPSRSAEYIIYLANKGLFLDS